MDARALTGRLVVGLALVMPPAGAAPVEGVWSEIECAALGGCSLVPTATVRKLIGRHEALARELRELKARAGACL